MFDTEAKFNIEIPSGGVKKAKVRWPTDEELCARSRKLRGLKKDIGRNRYHFDLLNIEQCDKELFDRIRVDGEDGAPFDEYEASEYVSKLLQAEVVEASRNGDGYYVEMRVPGGRVKHKLRMPSQKDVIEYKRAASRTTYNRGSQEIRFSIDHVSEMWNRLQVEATGYGSPAIPVNHKERALLEVMDQMAELDADNEAEPEP